MCFINLMVLRAFNRRTEQNVYIWIVILILVWVVIMGKIKTELLDHRGIPFDQLTKPFPSTKGIKKKSKRRKEIDSLANRYIKFLDKAKINYEVAQEVIHLARKKGFFKDKNNFKVENRDQTAFALVKSGKRPLTDGLRIVYTHTDSPCLQIKSSPVRFEWDPDDQPLHLGVELSIIPYGGAVPYQWVGHTCEVRGWTIKNGKRRRIKFDAYISDFAQHTDIRGESTSFLEAFPWEKIRLVTGHDGEKSLLEWLNFRNREDFARSRLYAVPRTNAIKLPAGDYIASYRHDDSAPTFVGLEALLAAKPTYTTMLIGFDKEEVGSFGEGGAKGPFFEKILRKTISKYLKIKPEKIIQGLEQKIIQNSYAISGDCDIAPSHLESEKGESSIDPRSVTWIGHGASISAADGGDETNQIPLAYMDKILRLVNRKKLVKRVVGCAHNADYFEGQGYHADYFTNRGIPTIELGPPVNSMHAQEELLHVGDLYWVGKAYEAFFNDDSE